MAVALRHDLPEFIERGVDVTLEAEFVDTDTNAPLTATAATFTLLFSSRVIVATSLATTLGPPVTFDLPAAAAADQSLSDKWQIRWAATIGGVVETRLRAAYLCRFVPAQVIVDTDLFRLHSDLARLRDSNQAAFNNQRDEAWVWVQKQLIMKGNRPELVLDNFELRDPHIHRALFIIFRDFALSAGVDKRYEKLADDYERSAQSLMDNVQFRYDWDEDGAPDDNDRRAARRPVHLNLPPVGFGGGFDRRVI